MNVSGMNTTSEDKAFAIASPVASCQPHSYNKISCSPGRESANQSKLNCHGLIDEFPFSLSGDSRETLLLRASIKSRVENHRPYSPASLDDESACLIGSNENSSECLDLKASDRHESPLPVSFKSPIIAQENCLLENTSESTSFSNSCLSPRHVSSCFTDSSHCNGSIVTSSSIGILGCLSPHGDVQVDMNGRSGSQTPASVNDSERIKMDLNKLDDTIDYVLSYARSDEPCEGMFVLPCRSREATQLASPNLRANTPSSSILASPSSSPLPPSPQSYRVVSSPMLNQPNRTQSLVQASSVQCVVSSQSVSRYVDQTSGLLHFPRSINSSGAPQGVSQPTVSFVHVYSDSSRIVDVRTSEQSGSHVRQPMNTTQMILHPNVIHGFQNHVVAPQNAFTVPPNSMPPRTFSSLVSPTKLNLVHALPAHVSGVGTLSPTYSSFAHPSEASGLVANRTVVFSPSNTVCVMQSPLLSPPPVYETPPNYPCDSQPMLNYTSFQMADKRTCTAPSPVSFRQPVAPPQPLLTPGVQCSAFPTTLERDSQVSVGISPNQVVRPSACNTPSVKKRSHASSSSGAKRRKTTAAATAIATPVVQEKVHTEPIVQPSKTSLQEYFEKLRSYDVKSLVSAPTLRPHTSVLIPAGGSDPPLHPLSDLDELELLQRRGLKYSRGSMSVQVPKVLHHKAEVEADNYIVQHLQTNTPLGPMVSPRKPQKLNCFVQPVCPSPEPPSFENHMQALFSSMHRSPKQENVPVADRPSVVQPPDMALLDPKLIPVFSEVSVGKPDPERCTPPLPLFHMPNPRLICQPIYLGTGNREVNGKAVEPHPTEPIIKQDSKVACSVSTVQPVSGFNGISSVNGPLIDSETGEVVAGRRLLPPEQSVISDSGAEKLHITFTISPSMSGGVSKIIRNIAESLGIDQSTVCYQVTRSGAQITLDQQQSHSENVMRNLESQLREHFTPLSLHVEKAMDLPDKVCFGNIHSDSDRCSISPTQKLSKYGISESFAATQIKDSFTSKSAETSHYVEEPVSISSLLSSKRTVIKPCQNCDKPVPPHAGQRKCLEEVASLSGLSSRTDINGDFVFCSGECLMQFSHSVSNRHILTDEIGITNRSTDEAHVLHSAESRQPTLACDFTSSIPVLLQCSLTKTGKTSKRNQSAAVTVLGSGCKKRGPGSFLGSFKSKRWRGSRWRIFSPHLLPQCTKSQTSSLCNEDVMLLLKDHPSRRRLSVSEDHRICLLCSIKGDAPEDGLGRLLPFDIDKWLHINCALWCFEVYETVGGSLNNVHVWLKKALETNCSHCGHLGAGLPCYNPRCTSVYHVSCAVELNCMFFTDRGMYCPQHQPKEQHPMQLLSLAVNRRVYIARDENNQVGDVIHEEDRAKVVRIGTVYLQSVGQLLPHQIESGLFHARRYIYPVGFRSTRIYWSTRKPRSRGRYICEILENDGKPLFKVTVVDEGLEDEVFTSDTCSGVWNSVLSKIELLREQDKLVRLFPEHLKGEDLYGLSEPHIIRAVESLPGVECLRDYVFHFGRMELIAEMPLAINPSGCARSEPKMQTYVKRFNGRDDRRDSVVSKTTCFPGLRRSVFPALTPVSAEFSKQYQSSRSQQYRRLKSEVSSNVILGRSRIQGLGLFAARDLEPQTMVIEYIGELIRSELANKREKTYEAHNRGIYMFRLDEDTVIDATVCGGLARYINHSCQPNCYAEFVTLGDHSHIVIITNRNIDKGEELCYDYNFDLEDRGSKIPCLCRAPNCRKWMN